ncbi:glutamate synthase subunit beta [Fervidibacillus albus]|uniref:Glutamate synthase subunit beta n=1 Tax=Fervidibacillus albus TaxID=2980026 RepID=A0A9E8LSU1_9BACI|nr:glutamate synthase subunit beta [Fervidibacillus albus]WAA08750.1 glutamate synthase subunit beta [Fervidibacillus albus]
MGKKTGFMEYERMELRERDPKERLNDWEEFSFSFTDQEARIQSARCMDCGTPFCHIGMEINGSASGCPIHNLIPEWNDLVYRGKWKEALDRLLKTNNFPEFTGRICPAPCEGSCTLGITDPPVAIKSIERKIIDKGFEMGWITPRIPTRRTGKRVAIIGSGPAGLAAADILNQMGHSVTVYEKDEQPGGLLMYGIPNMKLDKRIVQRRVRLLEDEGISFVTNTEVGEQISTEEIQRNFDSVIIATGAQKQRDLRIEGRDASGVIFAMDYLSSTTKQRMNSNTDREINLHDKHVIVIGGGDTGADCVATAIRQGCRSVVQFGKHPKPPFARPDHTPWPADPDIFTVDYAHREAEAVFGTDPRQYLIQTKKILKDERGHVKGVLTVDTKKIVTEKGVYFEQIRGTEKIWPADCVLIAIGFEGTYTRLLKQFGVDSENNLAKIASGKYGTNVEGIFAAGDVRRGQSLVVWAIREGREVAEEVDQYLKEKTELG